MSRASNTNPYASPEAADELPAGHPFAPHCDGSLIVCPTHCTLPPRCVRCNRPADVRRTICCTWISTQVTRIAVRYCLCRRHRSAASAHSAAIATMGVWATGAALGFPWPSVVVFGAITAVVMTPLCTRRLSVTRVAGGRVFLRGAGLPFLYSLGEEEASNTSPVSRW